MKNAIITFTSLLLFFFISNCEKDQFITDSNAKLSFSTDTVFFDTVFTTIGTTTQIFKVYNPHNKSIEISEIYLAGGTNSVFRMNIDGEIARTIKNKKIGPKDSLFIFVEATVTPNGDNAPIVIKDSVVFITNKNIQDIKLMAWGQDMHLYKSVIISSETWDNDKPYLIKNVLVVDSNEVLTINKGVNVHFFWNSALIVWGSLIVNGTAEEPVVFQGVRLEANYEFDPGQWAFIALVEGSKGNNINHAIIKNSIFGLWIGHDTLVKKSDAIIRNSEIINTSASGLVSFGADLEVYNTVFAKNGQGNFLGFLGGNFNFYHCTFHNPTNDFPAILLSNYSTYYRNGSNITYTIENELTNANFYNSIIYGNNRQENEVLLRKKNTDELNYLFDHCLLRIDVDSFDIDHQDHFKDNILNKDPKLTFSEGNKFDIETDFMLDTLSPAKDVAGKNIITVMPVLEQDILDKSRIADGKPDMGAFERIENE